MSAGQGYDGSSSGSSVGVGDGFGGTGTTSKRLSSPPISSQIRSPIKLDTLQPHIMPAPSIVPWNSCEMPWALTETYSGVMEFKGQPMNFRSNNLFVTKRKADTEMETLSPKQHISDEKMAEHLNSLHISSDFTSHVTTETNTHQSTFGNNSLLDDMDASYEPIPSTSAGASSAYKGSTIVNMTTQEMENKLKNAQRISICEQIRKLQNEPIIPQALLQRLERPCTALVLWQPPQSLNVAKSKEECEEYVKMCYNNQKNDQNAIDDQDNNNVSFDSQNQMDMDL